MGNIDTLKSKSPIEWFKKQDKDVKWLFGLGGAALLAATGSFFTFSNEEPNNNPNKLVIECAVNMLEPEDSIAQAELAISRCDSFGNLNSEQLNSLGREALTAFSQIDS